VSRLLPSISHILESTLFDVALKAITGFMDWSEIEASSTWYPSFVDTNWPVRVPPESGSIAVYENVPDPLLVSEPEALGSDAIAVRFVLAVWNVDCATVVPSARTRLELAPFHANLSVPELVTGEPETVNIEGADKATDVIVPDPLAFICACTLPNAARMVSVASRTALVPNA
jgi:hypothetical protein